MVRLELAIELQYVVNSPGADFIFNVQVAQTSRQWAVREQLDISQPVPLLMYTDPATGARSLRLQAGFGPLQVKYSATVDIEHFISPTADIGEVPVAQLPPEVLTYLYPSRYCQSDRLNGLAMAEFGHQPHGYARVAAIQAWVQKRVAFTPSSSNSTTSAVETLADGAGVCRDFAHLMIALCRAINIPARFTTGTDYGADPVLGPPDFHAYVEVYLGHRWYIFDPSGTAIPMGFVRIGTGHDAADCSFATIFGAVSSEPPRIDVRAQLGPHAGAILPYRRPEGVSTDGSGANAPRPLAHPAPAPAVAGAMPGNGPAQPL
jgi:transglutaminase-like putative cysteine protease